MRRPDLFIVGAPKCGTTALYSYLRDHPDVFLPAEKELYYFCDDLFSHKPRRTEQEYLALFADGTEAMRVGEATPWYLYSQQAPVRIKEFSPGARIVIALRDPVSLMYSLHGERVYPGQELEPDFATVMRTEKKGTRVPAPPEFDLPKGVEGYRDVARYAPFVKRFLDTFGRDAVHVIIFEDLTEQPALSLRALCRFLGVREANLDGFGRVNPHKVVRSRLLTSTLREPPEWLKWVMRRVTRRAWRSRVVEMLWRFNTARKPRRALDPELRRELGTEFVPAIRELEALLGRDLSRWTPS